MGRGKKGEAKMKIYATRHANDTQIVEDAEIYVFGTRAEAEAFLRKGFDFEFEVEVVRGDFSDCWKKFYTFTPDKDAASMFPFESDDLIVQPPGSHPGGKMYWITPQPEVLVAVSLRCW